MNSEAEKSSIVVGRRCSVVAVDGAVVLSDKIFRISRRHHQTIKKATSSEAANFTFVTAMMSVKVPFGMMEVIRELKPASPGNGILFMLLKLRIYHQPPS